MGGRVKGNYKTNGGAFVKQKRKPKVRKKKAEKPSPLSAVPPKRNQQNRKIFFSFLKKNRGGTKFKKM
jgi:hypothetical protein